MAVGVDYSLFYLKREREERERGRSTADAISIAAATSRALDRGVRRGRDRRDGRPVRRPGRQLLVARDRRHLGRRRLSPSAR